jgi:AcrR family transcriptional regulator
MSTDEQGLRARKKRALRLLLGDVALRLFAERGFDAVTVADIAAAANVSDKTVFNYFPTKEDLVLDGRDEAEAELVRTVVERPPGEAILAAVRRHTLALADRMNELPAERRQAFRKLVQSAPSVHARMRQMSLHYEDELTRIIMAEHGADAGDPTPRVIASLIGTLERLAYGATGWPDGKRKSHAEVIAGIHAAFDLIDRGLAGYGRKRRVPG